MKIVVQMTAAQKEHAEWALDPMGDFAQESDAYEEDDLPTIDGLVLIFPHPSLAVDDILYRLVEQLRDMADGACERYPIAAGYLAERIEKAARAAGWVRTMGHGWVERVVTS